MSAVAAGVNHIATSDYYGPHVTNQIIKKALHPYQAGLVIVTKLGARRGEDKSWIPALSRKGLTGGVNDNLRNLGVDRLDVVNLRVGAVLEPSGGSIEEPLTALAELKRQGLIGHIGLSNGTPRQLQEAQKIAAIVCIQKFYNVARRAMTMPSSMLSPSKTYPTSRSSRWEDSPHYDRRSSTAWQHRRKRAQCRSRLPGFFSVHLTFC